MKDYLPLFVAGNPLRFEPGEGRSYSNAGFIVLGLIIEKLPDRTTTTTSSSTSSTPAGMSSTSSMPTNGTLPNLAVGYMRGSSGKLMPNWETLPYRGMSAGGGESTVGDLLRFANALRGYKLLSPAMTELITSGKVRAGSGQARLLTRYGFCDRRTDDRRIVGHNGGAPGMNGELSILWNEGYTVAVLANMDPTVAQDAAQFRCRSAPMIADFKYAIRLLVKTPGFTIIAVLAIALGIGASTTAFSIVNAVLLRPFPFMQNQERLVYVTSYSPKTPEDDNELSFPDYVDIKKQATTLDGFGVWQNATFIITSGDTPERFLGANITAETFSFLGVQPILGRNFRPEEERAERPAGCADRLSRLAESFRRRRVDRRQAGADQRPPGHDRRRHAARLALPGAERHLDAAAAHREGLPARRLLPRQHRVAERRRLVRSGDGGAAGDRRAHRGRASDDEQRLAICASSITARRWRRRAKTSSCSSWRR